MNKNSRSILLAALLCVPAAALADTNYHLSRKGLCNNTKETIKVRYTAGDAITGAKPNGITHHKDAQDLKPGACATLSFKVRTAGVVTPDQFTALYIEVNDAWLTYSFKLVGGHQVTEQNRQVPKGYDIKSHVGGHEHFHIDVNAVLPKGKSKPDKPVPGGGDGGSSEGGGGESTEATKKAAPKK